MESRADIKRHYKETAKQAGVYQVKNLKSGKVLLHGAMNLHGPLNRHRFMLRMGSHPNAELQRDWNELGPDQFVFEVLAVVEKDDDPDFSVEAALVRLEQEWVDKLKPFGDRGYNQSAQIRD